MLEAEKYLIVSWLSFKVISALFILAYVQYSLGVPLEYVMLPNMTLGSIGGLLILCKIIEVYEL